MAYLYRPFSLPWTQSTQSLPQCSAVVHAPELISSDAAVVPPFGFDPANGYAFGVAPFDRDNIGTYTFQINSCVNVPNGFQVCNPTQFTIEVRDPCPEAIVVAAGWTESFTAMQLT